MTLESFFDSDTLGMHIDPMVDIEKPQAIAINKTVPRSTKKREKKGKSKVSAKEKEQDFVVVHGIKRGQCLVPNCDCALFSHKETVCSSFLD
jgi:hypothetical protein